jgi:hypothetical protein
MADTVYYVSNGKLYKSVENDGMSYLRRGPQEQVTCLGTVEEAQIKHPYELDRALRRGGYAVHEIPKTL